MQFADIVALESADAVVVAKAIEKGLEAVNIDKELLTERKTCGMHLRWCQCDDG